MRRASSSALRRMLPACSRARAGSVASISIADDTISTGFNGVRSSWLSAARKSSFARLAC